VDDLNIGKDKDMDTDVGVPSPSPSPFGANNKNNHSRSALVETITSGKDYGFRSRSEGCRFENVNVNMNADTDEDGLFGGYGPPANIFSIGRQQFMRNLDAMKGEYKDEDDMTLTSHQKRLQKDLRKLTLNSTAIWEREAARGEIVAPLVIKGPYYILCYFLDVVFEGRYVFSRFFLLETVARMPYMTYITMLHLYETLGFWRSSSDVKRVHFAEEWNEFHHLLVMESLGGDQAWFVRFIAQHSAIVYFWILSLLFAMSPSLSYKFSEMLETHAVDTYGQFIDENEEALKKLPPSLAALDYYTLGISDPMFGEYQTTALASGGEIRKSGKDMKSLYDVFVAIRADEGDHVGTMKACLDPSIPVLSPALEARVLTGFALAASVGYFMSTGELLSDVDLAASTAELLDAADDTVLTDSPLWDGIVGGAAALFGGLKGEAVESAAETASEIEEIALVPVLLNYFRQGLAFFLEVLGLL
jgi:ubiquinol oxidase